MCTGFAAYYGRPLYGMNFDFPKVNIKVKIEKTSTTKFICFYIYVFNHYSPLVGMNEEGHFVNLQELHLDDGTSRMKESANSAAIDGMQLFFDYLQGQITLAQIMAIDCHTRLVLPENYKIHNLYADAYGQATIVEGINGQTFQQTLRGQHLVMTNFAHALHSETPNLAPHLVGVKRYLTVNQLMEQAETSLDIRQAFTILKSAFQTQGQYSTQCSWVFDPYAQQIYFRLAPNFQQLWKISLSDETIVHADNLNAFHLSIPQEGLVVTDWCA